VGVTGSGEVPRHRHYEILRRINDVLRVRLPTISCVISGFINRVSLCVTEDLSEKLGGGILA